MGVDNLNVSQDVVYIEAGIYHGGELVGDTLVTTEQPKSLHPRWNQWLVFETTVKNLPKAARLCLKVRQACTHCVFVTSFKVSCMHLFSFIC